MSIHAESIAPSLYIARTRRRAIDEVEEPEPSLPIEAEATPPESKDDAPIIEPKPTDAKDAHID